MSEPQRKKGLFSRLFGSNPSEPAQEVGDRPLADDKQGDDRLVGDTAAAGESATAEKGVVPEVSEAPVALAEPDAPAPEAGVPAATRVPRAEAPAPEVQPPVKEVKTSWLSRLKSGLTKTSSKLSSGITGLFTKRKLDAETLDDFEDLLIQADLGVETATRIIGTLSSGRFDKGISPDDIRRVLADEVERVLEPVARPLVIDPGHKPHVILMVGVNGTGKTTTIGKLAQRFLREGRTVMLAAGDTFRAAAIDQLKVWGERSGTRVVSRAVGADAAGLAFDALKEAQAGRYDVLLIDTAGRLENKAALMEELEKVVRVLRKVDPAAPHDVLLVLDATTGQSALKQVEVFRQRAGVTGLVLTKLDGTARGGIIVAIADKFKLPVHAIGVGEGIDDMQPFEAAAFARAIADLQ
ncbi:MAG: signal recognition particle-docking protein FtsY [Hyphomicrobiaceae bacterium]|nr:signal recognition particle-docking protein FtsY [Hyphomicrobiaceae bacterium]